MEFERQRAGKPSAVVAGDEQPAAAGFCSPPTASSMGPSSAFEDALVEHEHLPMPFERARTLLVLGLLARRRNERRRADELLTEALGIFDCARGAAVGGTDATRAATSGRSPDQPRGPDPGRAARRRPGGKRVDEPPGRRGPVHQPQDGRVQPRPRLPEARDSLPRRARRAFRGEPGPVNYFLRFLRFLPLLRPRIRFAFATILL